MDRGPLEAAFIAVSAALGAVATMLLGRRRTSGRIATSEAEVLWRESTLIRQELYRDSEACKVALEAMGKRVAVLEQTLIANGLALP